LQFFHDQQLEFGKAFGGISGQNPVTVLADMTKKNMDAWGQMMGFVNKNQKSNKSD